MIIRVAKFLDEYAGRALIWFGVHTGFFSKSHRNGRVRKVLFIKFWGIGSIILSEPAIRKIHELYPEAEIHYLTLKQNNDLFLMMPLVSRVYCLDFKAGFGTIISFITLVKKLRKVRYDLIFDGEFFVNISVILARMINPGKVIGFGRRGSMKSRLLDECIAFHGQIHTAEQFLNLVNNHPEDLLSYARYSVPRLALSKKMVPEVPTFKPDRPYLVLNINASSLAIERRWPRERFLDLATEILLTTSFGMVLIGSILEMVYVKPLADSLKGYGKVWNLAGQLRLPGLAYVIRHASALISNDSGPVHMAAAFDTPTVGFYGPESPIRYGPLCKRSLVFYMGLWCSPCMSIENAKTVNCVNNLMCMRSIKTDLVKRRVCGFLQDMLTENGRSKTLSVQSLESGIVESRVTLDVEP